jgi:hypothetical protein
VRLVEKVREVVRLVEKVREKVRIRAKMNGPWPLVYCKWLCRQ